MKNSGAQVGAALLSFLLVFNPLALAQARSGLKIRVVEGEGAINNVQLGTGHDPVVEVRDQEDRPVSGAKVTFTLPEAGPGGSYFGAARTLTVTTNEQGRAASTGFRPNLMEGSFQIQVGAASGEQAATAVINQTNARPGSRVTAGNASRGGWTRNKTLAVLGVVGAVVAIALATRGDDEASSATTTPGTAITPGVVSVGNPR